jgi:hypothetical protein
MRSSAIRLAPLCVLLALTGCSSAPAAAPATQAATTAPRSAGTSTSFTAEQVVVGTALAEARGHHRVSLELMTTGETLGSLSHATHPVAEIIESIRSDLDQAGAATADFEASLHSVMTASQNKDQAALASAVGTAAAKATAAEAAVAGGAVSSPAYRGSVVVSLITTVAAEYSEAVSDGQIGMLLEYQDAYAFTREAADIYALIAREVEASDPDEAAAIDDAFTALATALPSAQPPPAIAPVEEVKEAAGIIANSLVTTVDALPVAAVDPHHEREEIEELLDRALDNMRQGNRPAAAELVAEAYLEHYETIEAQVIDAAPDINAELEPLLGAELRRQINEDEPVAVIEATVATAKGLLDQAIDALPHH